MNVYTTFFFLRLAIGLAGVIDPPRIIALISAIDELAAIQTEEKRVVRILGILPETFLCLLFSDPLALIFNDARACGNLASGEYTITVNPRVSDLDE